MNIFRLAANGIAVTAALILGLMLYVSLNSHTFFSLVDDSFHGTIEPLNIVQQKAERGEPVAQYELATRYLHGRDGLPEDRAKAREWFKKAADQGDSVASNRLKKMDNLDFSANASSFLLSLGLIACAGAIVWINRGRPPGAKE